MTGCVMTILSTDLSTSSSPMPRGFLMLIAGISWGYWKTTNSIAWSTSEKTTQQTEHIVQKFIIIICLISAIGYIYQSIVLDRGILLSIGTWCDGCSSSVIHTYFFSTSSPVDGCNLRLITSGQPLSNSTMYSF